MIIFQLAAGLVALALSCLGGRNAPMGQPTLPPPP
jgi:hypothetical protein